ncbi:hypothetical protein [Algoriphagus aquimarinus]|uniref:Uncharacterized protein n=1 Tax=Algoriphagus aquimarinus TaxID=237018 RepID=A0A1I1B394_9BACT|nr:hypothetical protein [Algoriphagus aquimarinus]SFB42993.1 hypothetical protein SAMN04489723_11013 [Algoriphagus aquimarinus]
MENRVSITIPPADLKAINDAVKVLQEKLGPLLISLTVDERRALTKMGEASRPFAEKVMEYVVTNPEFLPPYSDVAEMQKDWKAINELGSVYNAINQLTSNLDDTLMEAGSEVMEQANMYYRSVQGAVKANVPSSKPVYADLRVRYEKRSKRSGGDPAGV